jgi:hypothetical protein
MYPLDVPMLTYMLLSLAFAQAHPMPTLTLVLKDPKLGLYEATVRNPSQASWYFLGYSREYVGSSLPANHICPVPTIQYLTDGQWKSQFDGRCGVGINPIELKPGSTSTFTVHLAEKQQARVGLSLLATKQWSHYQQLWSNPIQPTKR